LNGLESAEEFAAGGFSNTVMTRSGSGLNQLADEAQEFRGHAVGVWQHQYLLDDSIRQEQSPVRNGDALY
jgi:hypothetical protein